MSEHTPQLLFTDLKVKWPIRFAFALVQPITQHYKQRAILKVPLQSIQSPRKIWMIAVYKQETMQCAIVIRHLWQAGRQGRQARQAGRQAGRQGRQGKQAGKAGSQSVSKSSIEYFFLKNFVATYWKHLWLY